MNKDDPLSCIISNYQSKIDRQNARVISDKNKYEVNTELREFEQAQRLQNVRHKVQVAEGEEESGSDEMNDNQHKMLEKLNKQA
jgi:hypothetical protein